MKARNEIVLNKKNMNEINLNKKENFDKISLILINNKIKFVRRFSGLINVILFEIFLFYYQN